MATEKIGKFHVIGTLGAGAHSSVLHIRRADDGRDYALKLIPIEEAADQKYLEQAKHEHRVGQMISHPNLLKVHLFETESDWLFRVKKAKLLLEYVPGKTLDQVPIINPGKLLAAFAQVSAGLAHLHSRSILHADLKPNNILYANGQAKIIDYGLAWIKGEPKDRVQGTPEYMAPETGTHKLINERTDIYNFGATMYRLATMKLPPLAIPLHGLDVDVKQWNKELVPANEINKGIPKELAKLIHRCLCFKAVQRPESMEEVREELESLSLRHPDPNP